MPAIPKDKQVLVACAKANQPYKPFNMDALCVLRNSLVNSQFVAISDLDVAQSLKPEEPEQGVSQLELDRWADDGGPPSRDDD